MFSCKVRLKTTHKTKIKIQKTSDFSCVEVYSRFALRGCYTFMFTFTIHAAQRDDSNIIMKVNAVMHALAA